MTKRLREITNVDTVLEEVRFVINNGMGVIMPRWAEPRGIRSRRVFVCVSAESFPELVLRVR